MYASLVTPEILAAAELDQYLEKGWFRLGKNLFTTSFLTFEETLFDALWLRVSLLDYQPSRSQKEILKKVSRFQIREEVFVLTDEKEELFSRYRKSVSFQPAQHLAGILPPECTIFNTRCISIYDDHRLIACGVFDEGQHAAEGIVNFFDPEYRRLSLGKALMLKKIQACKNKGMQWFYPGYVVPGYARFDYKLELSREDSEYYDRRESRWRSTRTLELKEQPLARMVAALVQLEGLMHSFGLSDFNLKRYRFYDVMLDPLYGPYDLMTTPYFIYCFPYSGGDEVLITFDVISGAYQLLLCRKMFSSSVPPEGLYYSEFLLQEHRRIFTESNPFNFVLALSKLLKRNVPEMRN